jgi:5-methylcytosine-specific restriction enzyme subunit McrC
MRRIDLREHQRSELSYNLSPHERRELREIFKVTIDPSDQDAAYHLTPGATVGAVEIGELSVAIEPKIGIPQLLSLACYAMGDFKPQDANFKYGEQEALPDILALSLAAASHRAFRRGLLHGYRSEEDALYGIRGRIRFNDQLRRRFGTPIPVEVRYDDFTDDILVNRLVKAAVVRLCRMSLRSREARRQLGRVAGTLRRISLVEYSQGETPEIRFDRLNEHYRGVVALARLILRHSAYQSIRGEVRASGFLVDMNKLFQEFVTRALREALGVSKRFFRSDRHLPCQIEFDEAGRVGIEPDLSWWDEGSCRFVGDAKYKNIDGSRNPPVSDLYQLLAYTTALDLPGGMLIYAKGEAEPITYRVRHSGKRLEVAALDLSRPLHEILAQVEDLARRVRELRYVSRTVPGAA